MVLPADLQPTNVVQPGKEPFHSPTSAVAPQGTAFLRRVLAFATMRCNHLDSITVGQITIQAVAVVSFIANQSRWEVVEEAVPEDAFNELAFVGRSAFDTNGERKTLMIGESEDFRAFATLGGPDRKPPFFSPMKEASMKASSSSSFPRACNSLASTRFAPLRPCAQDPQKPVEQRSCVLPRTTTTVGTPPGTQDWFDHFPLGIAEFPSPSLPSVCLLSHALEIAK